MTTYALWTNTMKKRRVITNAENFKQDSVAGQCVATPTLTAFKFCDNVLPFRNKGLIKC
jgi:hypothetical protein